MRCNRECVQAGHGWCIDPPRGHTIVSVASAQWIDYRALTWVATGVETANSTSDTGFLSAGSQVALVPGAAKGSHERRSVGGKDYAEATLIEAAPGSPSPPNRGARFWMNETYLR